jgi:hypothetical protein
LGFLLAPPSTLAKNAKGKSHTSKTALTEENVKFKSDTNATLQIMAGELKTKLTQDDLKGIREGLKKVEEKADETAFEMKIVMLVGAGVAFVLGVFINRIFARIIPDSRGTILSIKS